jgi:hypothetical protein
MSNFLSTPYGRMLLLLADDSILNGALVLASGLSSAVKTFESEIKSAELEDAILQLWVPIVNADWAIAQSLMGEDAILFNFFPDDVGSLGLEGDGSTRHALLMQAQDLDPSDFGFVMVGERFPAQNSSWGKPIGILKTENSAEERLVLSAHNNWDGWLFRSRPVLGSVSFPFANAEWGLVAGYSSGTQEDLWKDLTQGSRPSTQDYPDFATDFGSSRVAAFGAYRVYDGTIEYADNERSEAPFIKAIAITKALTAQQHQTFAPILQKLCNQATLERLSPHQVVRDWANALWGTVSQFATYGSQVKEINRLILGLEEDGNLAGIQYLQLLTATPGFAGGIEISLIGSNGVQQNFADTDVTLQGTTGDRLSKSLSTGIQANTLDLANLSLVAWMRSGEFVGFQSIFGAVDGTNEYVCRLQVNTANPVASYNANSDFGTGAVHSFTWFKEGMIFGSSVAANNSVLYFNDTFINQNVNARTDPLPVYPMVAFASGSQVGITSYSDCTLKALMIAPGKTAQQIEQIYSRLHEYFYAVRSLTLQAQAWRDKTEVVRSLPKQASLAIDRLVMDVLNEGLDVTQLIYQDGATNFAIFGDNPTHQNFAEVDIDDYGLKGDGLSKRVLTNYSISEIDHTNATLFLYGRFEKTPISYYLAAHDGDSRVRIFRDSNSYLSGTISGSTANQAIASQEGIEYGFVAVSATSGSELKLYENAQNTATSTGVRTATTGTANLMAYGVMTGTTPSNHSTSSFSFVGHGGGWTAPQVEAFRKMLQRCLYRLNKLQPETEAWRLANPSATMDEVLAYDDTMMSIVNNPPPPTSGIGYIDTLPTTVGLEALISNPDSTETITDHSPRAADLVRSSGNAEIIDIGITYADFQSWYGGFVPTTSEDYCIWVIAKNQHLQTATFVGDLLLDVGGDQAVLTGTGGLYASVNPLPNPGGEWNLYKVLVDGSDFSLYQNGVQVASGTAEARDRSVVGLEPALQISDFVLYTTIPSLAHQVEIEAALQARCQWLRDAQDAFIATINTPDGEMSLSLVGAYNITVDWGDGAEEAVTGSDEEIAHTYASPGTYIIQIWDNASGGFEISLGL